MKLPSKNKVTLPYGATSYPYSTSSPHSGVDYGYYPNPYVHAPEEMKITSTAVMGSCGQAIEASKGNRTYRFCHLSKVYVKRGTTVKEGKRIGKMGQTGYAFGKHLHFIMWVNGNRIDGDKYIRSHMSDWKKKFQDMKKKRDFWKKSAQNRKKVIDKLRNLLDRVVKLITGDK